MPTGYTAALYDGEQTFEAFVMRAARGMGALVTMRDAPMDAPIPERFEPSTDYHDRRLEEARQALRVLSTMTVAEAQTRVDAEYEEALEAYREVIEARDARRGRYEAMLALVRAWEPPTADHESFKEFMVEQLEKSIRFDCGGDYPVPVRLSAQEWLESTRVSAERDVAYHASEREREIEHAEGRTAWMRALRDSLAINA